MLLIILEHASVYRSIAESELSEPLLLVIYPLSLILLTVYLDFATISTFDPIDKLAFKEAAAFLKDLFVVLAFYSFAFHFWKYGLLFYVYLRGCIKNLSCSTGTNQIWRLEIGFCSGML